MNLNCFFRCEFDLEIFSKRSLFFKSVNSYKPVVLMDSNKKADCLLQRSLKRISEIGKRKC